MALRCCAKESTLLLILLVHVQHRLVKHIPLFHNGTACSGVIREGMHMVKETSLQELGVQTHGGEWTLFLAKWLQEDRCTVSEGIHQSGDEVHTLGSI